MVAIIKLSQIEFAYFSQLVGSFARQLSKQTIELAATSFAITWARLNSAARPSCLAELELAS